MTAVIPGDGGRLGLRFFPEPDTLTVEEYHRLVAALPAPPPAPPPAPRPIISAECARCGARFVVNPRMLRQRFCTIRCGRRFHARKSSLRKKAAA